MNALTSSTSTYSLHHTLGVQSILWPQTEQQIELRKSFVCSAKTFEFREETQKKEKKRHIHNKPPTDHCQITPLTHSNSVGNTAIN